MSSSAWPFLSLCSLHSLLLHCWRHLICIHSPLNATQSKRCFHPSRLACFCPQWFSRRRPPFLLSLRLHIWFGHGQGTALVQHFGFPFFQRCWRWASGSRTSCFSFARIT